MGGMCKGGGHGVTAGGIVGVVLYIASMIP